MDDKILHASAIGVALIEDGSERSMASFECSWSVDSPHRDAVNPAAGTRSAKERFFLGGKVRGVAMFLRHPRPATCSRSEVFIREF